MEDFSSAVNSVINDAIDRRVFPGASFLVIKNGKIVHSKAYGRFTYDPTSPQVDIDTVFDIASVTKAIVATCALVLVERGEIDLDNSVGSYLPILLGSSVGMVKIGDLLSHTSGIRIKMSEHALSDVETFIYSKLLEIKTVNLTEKLVEYSNVNTFLLGEIVGKVTRLSLDKALAKEIFKPLGMNRTTYSPSHKEALAIPPTEILSNGDVIQGLVHDESAREMRRPVGHAGIFSNGLDLIAFVDAWLNPGRIISKKSIDDALEMKNPASGLHTPLGWHLDNSVYLGEKAPAETFFHPGFTGTIIGGNRDKRLGFVFLSNSTYPDRTGHQLKNTVFHDILNLTFATFK